MPKTPASPRARGALIAASIGALVALPGLVLYASVRKEPPPRPSPSPVAVVSRVATARREVALSTKGLPRARVQIGFAWPIRNSITSPFGWRRDPFGDEKGARFHHGTDIRCSIGEVIRASAPGYVIFNGVDNTYGNAVFMQHDDGYFTLYGHMSSVLVGAGQFVTTGTPVGQCGDTGHVTGPHLHFEIRTGRTALDPVTLLPA